VSELRPSIGKFSGIFNLNDRDFSRVQTDFTKRLTIDESLPLLTAGEIEFVQSIIRNFLSAWIEIQNTSIVQFLGEDRYFAFDEQAPRDRTCNIWISSCKHVNLVLVDQLKSIVNKDLRSWRLVVRLPSGDEPDITIYRDTCIVGDVERPTQDEFKKVFSEWDASEKLHINAKSMQVRWLVGRKPLSTLDASREIFQLAFFFAPFGRFENQELDATLWVGTSGGNLGGNPHRISLVRIDGFNFTPSIFCFEGTLSPEDGWTFEKAANAYGEIIPIPIPSSSFGKTFVLTGFDNQSNARWEVEGTVGK
jgi:hypothetical protein